MARIKFAPATQAGSCVSRWRNYVHRRFGGASAGCSYAPTNFQVLPWAVDVTYQITVVPVNLK